MSTATAAAAAEGKTANGNSNGSNKRKRPRKEEVAGEHYPSFTSNKTKWFITAFAIVNYSAHCTAAFTLRRNIVKRLRAGVSALKQHKHTWSVLHTALEHCYRLSVGRVQNMN
jgi:hypothetical protein